MSNTLDIAKNLKQVTKSITELEAQYGRPPGCVTLLAVSKTKPVSAIREAINAGQRQFGENYLDEAVEKIQALKEEDCQWHFIGGIQSRKTQLIAEHFDWVHSVDRIKLVNRLANQRPAQLQALNVCLQVNLDQEQSKSGALETDLAELAYACEQHENLKLRGLMAIPAPRTDIDEQRLPFARLAAMFNNLRNDHPSLDTLSMGMSSDLPAAIAEGATIVRVGTAIFGQRN